MGDDDGDAVGFGDGDADGTVVGDVLGLNVGDAVGEFVGEVVGTSDGAAVGDAVGEPVLQWQHSPQLSPIGDVWLKSSGLKCSSHRGPVVVGARQWRP